MLGWLKKMFTINAASREDFCDQVLTPLEKQDLERAKSAGHAGPEESSYYDYAERLKEYVDAERRFNEATKDHENSGVVVARPQKKTSKPWPQHSFGPMEHKGNPMDRTDPYPLGDWNLPDFD